MSENDPAPAERRTSPPTRRRIPSSDILVIGIGNVLLGDGGAGVRAAELARSRLTDVHVVASGAIGPATIADLEGFSHIIVLDSIDVGRAPGTIVWFEAGDLSPCASSAVHEFGVADLLMLVGQTSRAPEEAIVLGCQPATLDMGAPLSLPVLVAIPRMVDQASLIIRAWADGVATFDRTPLRRPCPDLAQVVHAVSSTPA
ncbi:MAG TPA: hydrogenase maturation protease [Actinomycetota bacterium]|nr:hydrogenase maturation protease [Actinomycetota bacterium]